MNDNDLRQQAIREFSHTGLIPKERILFSKQLQKYNTSGLKANASLILIDESHYAGSIDSQIDKFLN